jgi:signal transduction histidine kinase
MVSLVNPQCCWNQEQIAPEACQSLRPGDDALLFDRKQRFIQRCLECPRFFEDLRNLGQESDTLASLFPYAMEELLSQKMQLTVLSRQFASRSREIRFLHEIGQVLQASMDLDEVLAMALTAVTSGKGFGLNRAILLLVDPERQLLRGHFAVGPRHREEANRIWQEIASNDYSLEQMGQHFFEQKMVAEKGKFRDLLDLLSVPLNRPEHLFVKTLNEQLSHCVDDLYRETAIDRSQVEALGVRQLLLVPLVSHNNPIGLLLADNIINNQPIGAEDMQSLETFALPVSFAIERAAYYLKLQDQLAQLTEANRRLKEQQNLILRMEKMALVGKLTANIAHSIRNPLTIIGGFARTLSRSTDLDDSRRTYIESIVKEARKLEEVLQEVLTYSESLHPTLDLWDVNQLLTGLFSSLSDDLRLHGIDGRLQLDPGLPLLRIDYKKLSYCLRSIVSNALEAMPSGGCLSLSSRRQGDDALLQIADSGPGMDPETLQAATTPFFSTKDQGTGLGLSLCARILEGHGARLEIASELGVGTTFTIRLKLIPEGTHGQIAGG